MDGIHLLNVKFVDGIVLFNKTAIMMEEMLDEPKRGKRIYWTENK